MDAAFAAQVQQALRESTGASDTQLHDAAQTAIRQTLTDFAVATNTPSVPATPPQPLNVKISTRSLDATAFPSAPKPNPEAISKVPVVVTGCLNGGPGIGVSWYKSAPVPYSP